VLWVRGNEAAIATRGTGSNLNDQLKVNLEQLSYCMHGVDNARALLTDAVRHNDSATVRVTSEGLVYDNRQQKARLTREAATGATPQMIYPKPLNLSDGAPTASHGP
jgi:hypothetical protein